jgi:hypothetical protein
MDKRNHVLPLVILSPRVAPLFVCVAAIARHATTHPVLAPHPHLVAPDPDLLPLRRRSVSAIAATIATSRITAAISNGYTYSVYSSRPSASVLL